MSTLCAHYTDQGHRAFERGDFAIALRHYKAALALSPKSAPLHLAMGLAAQRAGDAPASELHFAEAARLEPESGKAHYMLGTLQRANGKAEAACMSLETAVRLAPELAVAQLQLAELLKSLGQSGKAEHHLRLAVKGLPDYPPAARALGELLCARGSLLEGIALLESASRQESRDPAIWLSLGVAYGLAARWDEASKAHQHAASLLPGSGLPFFQMGWLLYRAEQLPAASEAFEAALRVDTTHVPSLMALGIVHGRSGAYGEANACFEKVLRVEPDNPDAGFWLGVGLTNQSRFDEARRHLQGLVERHPDAALASAALSALTQPDRSH